MSHQAEQSVRIGAVLPGGGVARVQQAGTSHIIGGNPLEASNLTPVHALPKAEPTEASSAQTEARWRRLESETAVGRGR